MSDAWDPDRQPPLKLGGVSREARGDEGFASETRMTWCFSALTQQCHAFPYSQEILPCVRRESLLL